MKTLDLYLLLSSYILTVATAAVAELIGRRRPRFLLPAAVAIALLIAHTVVGAYLDRDQSYSAILRYLIDERDLSSVAALLMGLAAGVVWFTRYLPTDDQPRATGWRRWEPALLVASLGTVVLCGQAFIWKEVLGITRHAVSVRSPDFVIEKVADFDDEPLRVAAGDDGDVFVCYDYFKKHGAWGGTILRFHEDPATGKLQRRTVVESPLLARCYGLALREGDIYVSRSGFYPKSTMGQVSYESTGAITRLKDLDGDGYFEYAHDVITGLPGVRAPDTMQQNNGLAFASDGSLFVTNASAADRTLDEHLWGGTILRYNADFSGPVVWARGFRNPWTIAFGPDNALFATDSDVDKNPGDEINHVVQGGHYGHPFVIPNEADVEPIGFREPMLVGERETVFLGLVYATSNALPEAYRNCMYVTDFRRNRVLRIRLARTGDTYRVEEVSPFASIPSPVDLAVTSAGDFYVISRRAQKMFRIRLKKAVQR
jgi:glucose/arabinose dehydrogenase